ncbi:midasin [Latimeria chalumnae]
MENLQFCLSSLKVIATANEKSRSELSSYLAKQIWTQHDRQCILSTLAQLLLDKDCTFLIGRHLRPLLLDLLERNAVAIKSAGQINHDLHERLCVTMSKLIGLAPDVLPFALRYFKDAPPVFQRLFLESSDSSLVRYGRKRMKLRDLMEAAYRFLQQNQPKFSKLWDWSMCAPLLRSHDTLVRWYTANCLALVTQMNDEHKSNFLKKVLSSEELLHFRVKLIEEAEMQNVEKALFLCNPEVSLWQREKCLKYTQGQIVSSDLSTHVVAVCGVVLPKQQLAGQEQVDHLVLVESTCSNLQSLALAVASQNPVLLEGPIGCGKTALVEYLAAVTGRGKPPAILKVQLGDQTDSKMLLGMYRCTDVPGEFIWQPGTLTQAVSNGYWILLEDIDYAPLDVISVLIPLLENGELLIPGRGDYIKAASGFQFFATRRLYSSGSGWYRQQNTCAALLDKHWTKIKVDNMSRAELKEVLQSKYQNQGVVTDRLLDIYCQLTGDKHQIADDVELDSRAEEKRPCLEGRGLSLRDLLKWCERIANSFESNSSSTAQNIFQEALDCFTAMLSKQGSRQNMAEVIGTKLNISKQQAEFFCQLYKPDIDLTELEVRVGRTVLPRKQAAVGALSQKEKQTFAATRPSCMLIEQLAVCVNKGEPVLLVGETGTGKTSTVQYLASLTGHKLRVVNMNQQSDTADLLGGYKPVDHKLILLPLREAFEELFTQTFSRKQNTTFLGHIQMCYKQKRWQDLLKLMQHVHRSAISKELKSAEAGSLLKQKWEAFGLRLNQAQQQMKVTENALVFAFVEGMLSQAVKKGEWILLDEINLAAAETLECLSGLLERSTGSLVLLDRGDTEPIVRHPDFRLFACMNPATDVGKRNLPPGIRNRFTEIYVEELEDEGDLRILISDYLKGLNVSKNTVQGIVRFYLTVRSEASAKLMDGTGHRPHYSLRTLCRALKYAAFNPCYSAQRSLYEGFCLSFLTQLDRISHPVVQRLICQHIISGNTKSLLKQPIPEPQGKKCSQMEGYWIPKGDRELTVDETYILTPSVKLNLRDLVRVVSAGTHPVLIQGETSVGKTSLIGWLAAATGNHCVRINNHEHTDIQEYIGCYASNASGKLVFMEGVLIDAMRKGYWIILDELNLAPTDVLEALNRLLDDNRELFITETQEVVKAHPRFILFATQNPPGLYGGRKVLSRAFRNRFVELHFDELPSAELETILHKRCSLPPSYCTKLVKVMLDLQSHRRGSTVFAGKHGFITLRDLFRWAERYRLANPTEKDYDWLQHLANDGFMLLGGRVRKQEEVAVIQGVLEKHFKRKLNPEAIFSEEHVQKQLSNLSSQTASMGKEFSHIVWTQGMRRLAVLVGRALEFGEPVLLVGDTGCGKTTICQLFAVLADQKLHCVNCHLHMETSDFLGGLRPVRHRSKEKSTVDSSKLFEWHDGPLVLAMREGGVFLLDEISLADDSVLERLNSVLEVEKTVLLAEKGSGDDDNVELLTAGKNFRILATMNPGGDFGKKELSPALRNRFTEVWCPQSNSRSDLSQIVQHNLRPGLFLDGTDSQGADIAKLMLDFIDWLTHQEFGHRCILSVRDILSWVDFMNLMTEDGGTEMREPEDRRTFHLDPVTAFVHAACLVYIDSIGSGMTFCVAETALLARKECLGFLREKLSRMTDLNENMMDALRIYDTSVFKKPVWTETYFGIHPFYIPRAPFSENYEPVEYTLNAGTTAMNAQRLLRALKLNRPILLEGSPGVGKTSLVAALAKASGNHLVRINLSEQTDVTDLFGTDLPVEGGKGGQFAWRDGPLLAALKAGHWIVLDELNLASQSVLEGLNACFDHRAEIFVPELGLSFRVQHEKTKVFGCQNPFRQGGGRKGLPKSFLNRFTQVYVDQLSLVDMEFIGNTIFPAIGKSIVAKMVQFNNKINLEVMVEGKWGIKGGPWEFNLRDLFRWCQLMLVDQSPGCYDPGQHVGVVYADRMRMETDRNNMMSAFKEVFGTHYQPYSGSSQFHITPHNVQVGYSVLSRGICTPFLHNRQLSLLRQSFQPLESIMKCVQMGWMVILVGPTASGKTSLVQLLALLTGHRLKVMAMSSALDTTELLGGFEQVDIIRPWHCMLEKVEDAICAVMRDGLLFAEGTFEDAEVLLQAWSSFSVSCRGSSSVEQGSAVSTESVKKLEGILVLLQRLNNRINSLSKAEFSELIDDFRQFKNQLSQSLDGRSRGTFEWVDGVLVQALQAGDWLLMDNVNFCSPSVLDRLNALLEPGGVLTLSERGVIDGTTPTIVPHPNFRLFLAMDPVHGEISRAMRNRGIEIFIPGETEGGSLDQLDAKMLLHGLGLMGGSVCDTLVAVHSETKESIPGFPTSSTASLIRAATLIIQQLQRGFSLTKAFYRACWEVYTCSQHSQANQKQVQEIVLKHLSVFSSQESWGNSLLSLGVWPSSVPSALLTAEDSILSMVQRDGQILTYCLNRLSLNNNRTLPLTISNLQKVLQSTNMENLTFGGVDGEAHGVAEMCFVPTAVRLVTEKASNQDWLLRVRWLNHMARKISQLPDVRVHLDAGAAALNGVYSSSLSAGIQSVIELLQPTTTDRHVNLLDPRWNIQHLDIIYSMNFDTAEEHSKQLQELLNSIANRVTFLMNRERQAFIERNTLSADGTKRTSRNSALRISMEFSKDPGNLNNLPHPVVAHLAAFFELWDISILQCIQTSQTALPDEVLLKLLHQTLWRDRFWAVSDVVSTDSLGLALLSLHWHWVVKHVLSSLPRMLTGHDQYKFSQEVQAVSTSIENCFTASAAASASLKRIQKSLGQPLPFKVESVVEAATHLKTLTSALDVVRLRLATEHAGWNQEMCRLRTAALGWSVRKSLLHAWGLVLRANHLEETSSDVLKTLVETQHFQLLTEGVINSSPEDSEEVDYSQHNAVSFVQLSSKLQMWPAMEYLALLWQYKLVVDIIGHTSPARWKDAGQGNLHSDLSQHTSFCLTSTPASSEQLRAFWHLLHSNRLSPEELSLLWSELVSSTLVSFWSSTVTTDPDYWLTWKPQGSTQEEGKQKPFLDKALMGPAILNKAVFSKCIFELLAGRTSQWDGSGLQVLSSSHVTLGEWKERAQQLKHVSEVLWTNMAASSVAEFSATDLRLQSILLHRQLQALGGLVPSELQEEYLQECEKLTLKEPGAFQYLVKVIRDVVGQEELPEDLRALLLTCLQQFVAEEKGPEWVSPWARRGSVWVNVGLLQIQVWTPQTMFDPAVKREYKLRYANEELNQLQSEWKCRELSSQLLTGRGLEEEDIIRHTHPHIRLLQQRIHQLQDQIADLSKKQAFRPNMSQYDRLYQDIQHYIASIAQASKVQDLLARLMQVLHGKGPKSRHGIQSLLNEEAAWQQSHHQFRKRLVEEYLLYPDITGPLQAAILQMQHGMRLVASEVHANLNSPLVQQSKLGSLVACLLAFPSISSAFPSYFVHADALCSQSSLDVLRGLEKLLLKYSSGDGSEVKDQRLLPTQEELLINALLYLQCHALSKGELDQESLLLFRHICQAVVNDWAEQEHRAREKEQQETSLYRYRSKSHGTGLSEEQQEEQEFRKHFPQYEKDFADITSQPSLEEKMETEEEYAEVQALESALVSPSSVQTLVKIHQQMCLRFANSLWYQQNLPARHTKEYLSAFVSSYQTAAALVTHFYPLIDSTVSEHLLGSQMLVSSLIQNTVCDPQTSDLVLLHEGAYDFYQHPNVQQVRLCQPVLADFTKAVKGLLQEWPDHPALVQLVVVMDRIRCFPLSCPLSKFLNGLEILLAKSQDWEENASRALSLRKHLDAISQLIIQWRRLELNCWSTSLDNTLKRYVQKSSKHWFSVHQLVEKYLQDQTVVATEETTEEVTLSSLAGTLQAFIEGSTVGEFHSRLSMLLAFHCHVLLIPQQEGRDSLCSLLWNLYNYYKQFSDCVQAKIIELRHPIEKELKDFVKISRWNDVSFWAIKQSVDKTHRMLFKFVKKFEAALSEPCRPALIEQGNDGNLDCLDEGGEETKIQRLNDLSRKMLSANLTQAVPMEEAENSPVPDTESLQGRLQTLTKRMKKMCTKLVKKNPLPNLVEKLDQFTGDLIIAVHELQNLSVDQTAEKDRQKSELKHILMQKQRALSDLFKQLSRIGLSYRKGLTWSRTEDPQESLCLHPLDLKSAVSTLQKCSTELESTLLAEASSAWDGCQKYFYRSIARHCRLKAALLAPAKELGLGTIERCKGFTAHLMKLLVKQRRRLTGLTEEWVRLRSLTSCVQEIRSSLTGPKVQLVALPPQNGVHLWIEKLQALAMQCAVLLEQLSWFLQCCPPEESRNPGDDMRTEMMPSGVQLPEKAQLDPGCNWPAAEESLIQSQLRYPSPMAANWLPTGCRMRKQDKIWEQLTSRVAEMLVEVKAVKAEVEGVRRQSWDTLFYSWKDFEICSAGLGTLKKLSTELWDVQALFTPLGATGYQPAVSQSLEYVRGEVDRAVADFTAWTAEHITRTPDVEGSQEAEEGYIMDFSQQLETAINSVLCVTQNLVKKSREEDGQKEEKTRDDDDDAALIQPGLLTRLLEEDLSADVLSLNVQKVASCISQLLERLKYTEHPPVNECQMFNQACCLLVRLLPMLSTYSSLVQYYLTLSLALHRSTGKLLSVLAAVFTDLAQKGFCLPKELMEDSAGEGATEFHDYEGGGIGEGEGMKDVSDKIENEEQVEDTHRQGEEKEEQRDHKDDIKDEENAVEMSDDFEGKMHDGERKEQGEEEDDESEGEDEELDKQMGDLGGTEADKLDERLWGDDDDDDDDSSDKAEELGPGMDEGESELVAKDDNKEVRNQKPENEKRADKEEEQPADNEEGKEKIHEQIDEREYDENEIDPYHGNQEKQPEAKALDLPDNLNLEDEEGGKSDEEEGEGDNPYDIEEKPVDLDEKVPEEGSGEEAEAENPGEEAEEKATEPEGGNDHEEQQEDAEDEPVPEEPPEDQQRPAEDDAGEQNRTEDEEKGMPADQGLQPKEEEEEEENPAEDQDIPEAAERMEHEAAGQTGDDNLQSDAAVELAGAASEKDRAKEEHGSGAADASQSEGHESKLMARVASVKQTKDRTQGFKRKPGQADNERSTGDHREQVHKRLRTVESSSDMEQKGQSEQKMKDADVYEHIKGSSESYDAQTYDVASTEQQKPEGPLKEAQTDAEDIAMEAEEQEEEDLQAVDVQELKPEETKSSSSKTPALVAEATELELQPLTPEDEEARRDGAQDTSAEEKPERSQDSTIHTVHHLLTGTDLQQVVEDPEELRRELEQQLDAWQNQQSGNAVEEKAAAEMWQQYQLLTSPLSQQLCEQLRLILEPTQAAKLRGDFRTGKRLNMRKVIPYIASQFRKDKIWLRRTKPSKRQYQICLAVDDSSSMIDNHSKQLAFESLAVIGNALTLLEVGQIAVCSFGETVQLLHPFHEQFNDQSGARILRQCTFQQKKTKIAQFLESAANMFAAAQQYSQSINPETAQLLLIVSDGRGLFLEGKERVTRAVQTARDKNVFVIFVVLDNPNSRDSILDIKVPVFKVPGEMPEIRSYMEEFPFPFYIILRDVNSLPETLSDALRQWFELVTAADIL